MSDLPASAIIDSIPFPRERRENEYMYVDPEATENYNVYAYGVIESSMAKCKELYERLQETLKIVLAYKISYERAIESNGYALVQLEKAKGVIAKIGTDEHKEPIEKELLNNIEENKNLTEALQTKNATLDKLVDALNALSAKVIEKNKELDTYDY
jgi:hypothetical protein